MHPIWFGVCLALFRSRSCPSLEDKWYVYLTKVCSLCSVFLCCRIHPRASHGALPAHSLQLQPLTRREEIYSHCRPRSLTRPSVAGQNISSRSTCVSPGIHCLSPWSDLGPMAMPEASIWENGFTDGLGPSGSHPEQAWDNSKQITQLRRRGLLPRNGWQQKRWVDAVEVTRMIRGHCRAKCRNWNGLAQLPAFPLTRVGVMVSPCMP